MSAVLGRGGGGEGGGRGGCAVPPRCCHVLVHTWAVGVRAPGASGGLCILRAGYKDLYLFISTYISTSTQ